MHYEESLTCWIEAKPPSGGDWQRYDLIEPDSGCHGESDTFSWIGPPLDFALQELAEYLPCILRDRGGRPELAVRVRVWPTHATDSSPVVVLQATDQQMEAAKLALEYQRLAEAEFKVRQQRQDLLKRTVERCERGLAVQEISRMAAPRFDEGEVQLHLAARRMARWAEWKLSGAGLVERAWAEVDACEPSQVLVGLHATEDEEDLRARMGYCATRIETEAPERAQELHTKALRRAQQLIDAFAEVSHSDRPTVSGGEVATAQDLAPEPLAYRPATLKVPQPATRPRLAGPA